MRQAHQDILRLISIRNFQVGVIGMGHVGLPARARCIVNRSPDSIDTSEGARSAIRGANGPGDPRSASAGPTRGARVDNVPWHDG